MKALLSTATKPLGQMLQDRGLITEDDLKNALALQQERKDKLGRILIDLGYVAERDVLAVLSEQLKIELFTGEYPAVPVEPTKLSYRFLRAFHVIPVHLENNVLSLVMADPLDTETQSAICMRTGCDLRVYLASEPDINEQLEKLYGGEEGANERLIETLGDAFAGDDENIEHLRDLASEVPVIRMVNLIISRAVE
ncbi:MAG: type II secretion system protein GspE, partial [Acidobacteria bacterium]|nr:type II secretion system protein GspE [Acidobacteriota bacterium]